MNMRRTLAVATTMCGMGLAGCGAEDPTAIDESESELGQIRQEVTGGSLVTSTSSPWSSAVKFQGICSGLKVGARWYLTAQHCSFTNGQSVTITNSLDGLGGTTHTLSAVVDHPTVAQNSVNIQWWDLRLIKVNSDNNIPIHTPTYALQSVGDQGYFVGYGCDSLTPANDGKKQTGFSQPTDIVPESPWPGMTPNSFFAPGTPRVCNGDSGGPFFKLVNNQWRLTGMNRSFVAAGSHWNRIYGAADWINAVKADLPGHNNLVTDNAGTFINMWSNVCLGSGFQQQACRFLESADQRFKVAVSGIQTKFRAQDPNIGLCLGPVGSGIGARMGTVPCDTTQSNWSPLNSSGQFRQYKNQASGLCMRATSQATGTNIVQGPCSGTQDYYWVFSD